MHNPSEQIRKQHPHVKRGLSQALLNPITSINTDHVHLKSVFNHRAFLVNLQKQYLAIETKIIALSN